MKAHWVSVISASLVLSLSATGPVSAETKGSNVQKQESQKVVEVPRCAKRLGSVSIINGDNSAIWDSAQLAPLQKLLKAIVLKSNCFSVVDRGVALDAAANERTLNNQGLGLQRGSNVGKNQIKAADFVLVAELTSANSNASGNGVGAALGGASAAPLAHSLAG